MKRRMNWVVAVGMLALASACGPGPNPFEHEQPTDLPNPDEVRGELLGLAFREFLDESFTHLLRRSPESVLELGLEIEVGKSFLDDVSDGFQAETRVIEGVILEQLRSYDRAALSNADQVAFDVY